MRFIEFLIETHTENDSNKEKALQKAMNNITSTALRLHKTHQKSSKNAKEWHEKNIKK